VPYFIPNSNINSLAFMATKALKGKVKFKGTNNDFFNTLKKRVNLYFDEAQISKHANFTMVLKTIVLLVAYIGSFVLLITFKPVFWWALLIWVFMGLAKAGIGMCIMHDANHGAYSANKIINQFLGWSLHLAGGAVHNWKLQHNILHHTYTNISDMDDDIDAKVVLRLSPHSLFKKFHTLQYVYALFVYGLTTLYWVLGKDFIQMYKYTKNGVNPKNKSQNRILLVKIAVIKLAYLGIIIGLPIAVGMAIWQVILGFLLMHFTAGIVLTVVFQLAHSVEGTSHPLPTTDGFIENNWAIHQMNTTVNFAHNNKLLSWYVGGLNFQIEHHLFPKICHVHYPQISKIVKRTAKEFNIPYLENKTFFKAVVSHFKLLRKFGQVDLHDAIA